MAICSGVASTRPWPMAVDPRSSGPSISSAAGIVLASAPEIVGSSLKPKRSAAFTSRSAPTSTPSGAKTELHELAKLSLNDPPHASPPAFDRGTPSITASVCTGNCFDGVTFPESSAAVVVTSLNTEPGGCGAEKATPASARILPVRGSTAAMPPKRPARAVTAAACTRVSIVERTGPAARGSLRRHHTIRRRQGAAGAALHLELQCALESTRAHGRVRREPAGV